SPVRVQVRLLFERSFEVEVGRSSDYDAICWLVEQKYLTPEQAAQLIEALAKEVLGTLLPLQLGNYDLLIEGRLAQLPRFCHLELGALVEACQVKRLRQPMPRSNNGVQPRSPSGQRLQRPMVTSPKPPQNFGSVAQGQIPSPPQATPSPNTLQKTTYTIACIDDSPTVLNAIEAFLDDKAFKVLRIEDPVVALMQIIRNKPHLILLDVTMPNLDGYELCSLLRRHPSFKKTPIIMVTGNTGFIDRAKAKLVGASGYLTKPFTQPDLLKIVFKHLN
ncbi:MAG: response regulator, partial [Leptolyngbya sp. SIO1D8]|nr:response regulator [Leptolyngbya sp. SIO1D8]